MIYKNRNTLAVVLSTLSLGFTSELNAFGFSNDAIGVRSIIMGNTMVSLADDASAVFHNPAGMAFHDPGKWHTNIYAFTSHSDVNYKARYNNGSQFSDTANKELADSALVAGGFRSKTFDDWSIGFGFYVPYAGGGSGYSNFQNTGQDIEGFAAFPATTLAAAYKVSDKFSVGGGLSVYSGILETKNAFVYDRDNPTPVVVSYENKFSEALAGYGAHISLFYKPQEKWTVGLNVRSKVPIKMDGEETIGTRQDSSVELTMPHEIHFGLAHTPSENLYLGMHISRRYYGSLDRIKFELSPDAETHYRHGWSYGLGFQRGVNSSWDVIGGLKYYEQIPTDEGLNALSSDVPQANISLGLIHKLSGSRKLETGANLSTGSTKNIDGQDFEKHTYSLYVGYLF